MKPAYMLLGELLAAGQSDHVYLTDFGFSKQSLASLGLTSAGHFLGTLEYVAPRTAADTESVYAALYSFAPDL